MKITKNLYSKIMEIVRNTLDYDEEDVQGLFIDDEVLDGMLPEDSYIFVNIDKKLAINTTDMNMGMTKLVIMPEGCSYVIKIPFTGMFNMPYDYKKQDYEQPTLSYKAVENIIDSEMACYDYVPDKLLELLVPNIYVGNYGALPIYIQKRMGCIDTENYVSSETSIDYVDPRSHYDRDFIDSLIGRFGIAGSIERIDLMNEYLEDLHNGNYGYDQFGNGFIFDYGGYDSCMWEYVS